MNYSQTLWTKRICCILPFATSFPIVSKKQKGWYLAELTSAFSTGRETFDYVRLTAATAFKAMFGIASQSFKRTKSAPSQKLQDFCSIVYPPIIKIWLWLFPTRPTSTSLVMIFAHVPCSLKHCRQCFTGSYLYRDMVDSSNFLLRRALRLIRRSRKGTVASQAFVKYCCSWPKNVHRRFPSKTARNASSLRVPVY